MKIFDRYLFKNLLIATLFIAVILAVVVFLTQSLRFLELVLGSGNSGLTFWILTSLALPRFFEIILPISIMAAILFLYNKMTIDSEITAMRATGYSPFSLGRPSIILACMMTVLLWGIAMWLTPLSLAKMQSMRAKITSEFSTVLFREGVFNQVSKGLTVYIKDRTKNGELAGLMIHDTRDETKPPSTILAKRGIIVTNNDVQQVIVFNGSRQQYNPNTGVLQKLAFDRYTIDLPSSAATDARWSEPEERTIIQLLNPDKTNHDDMENLRQFNIEIQRRITAPLQALSFSLIALCALLLGPLDRRGQGKRMIAAIITIMALQGLYLAAYNLAKNSHLGIILMYLLTLGPIITSLFLLSAGSEKLRRKILYMQRDLGNKKVMETART